MLITKILRQTFSSTTLHPVIIHSIQQDSNELIDLDYPNTHMMTTKP